MKVGDYTCHQIDMGSFLLDGGAMFGIVPKKLWAEKIPSDSQNRIPMKSRSLLLKSDTRIILVDTGCGNKLNDKLKSIYGISDKQPDIDGQLMKLGVDKNEITDVILTHLHFDHAGGATEYQKGTVVPSFENATYYVHNQQWEAALAPSERDRASYFDENYIPLKDAGVLKVIDDNEQPFDGVELIISNGHTKGQLLPLVLSPQAPLFYCGDLIPTSAHVPVAWHMGYDNYPLIITAEKKTILERAYKESWMLFFEHDPSVAACTLSKDKKGFLPDKIISFN